MGSQKFQAKIESIETTGIILYNGISMGEIVLGRMQAD